LKQQQQQQLTDKQLYDLAIERLPGYPEDHPERIKYLPIVEMWRKKEKEKHDAV
jgi:hypothetical protein